MGTTYSVDASRHQDSQLKPRVVVDHATKYYATRTGQVHALEDVSLAVHEGAEAFVGLNKFFGLLFSDGVELGLQTP